MTQNKYMILSFKIPSILIFTLLIACQGNRSSGESDQSTSTEKNRDSFLLERIVQGFLSDDRVKSDIITLQCFKSNDSLRFSMIDAYPNLEEATFLGYTSIKNRKVCVVGDSVPLGIISIESKKVPIEVSHRNEDIKNSKKLLIEISEPFVQSVCYKGRNLIKCPIYNRPNKQ
jgi:hypothetical protein